MKQAAVFLIFLTLACSCNLNNRFLKPTRMPRGVDQINLHDPETNQVTVFKVYGPNLQPIFIRNETDTIEFDFSIEGVVFESSNGNKINGWFLKPKEGNPDITLLHLHGNAGFLLSQYGAIMPLLKQGFQIFTFDYSGFGFSAGKATRDNVLADALSAARYLAERPDVANTKLVLYGQSLGGHVAAVVAAHEPGLVDGIVIEGAFSSHKDIAAHRAGLAGRIAVKEKYSATQSIKNVKKPVLIIHSTEDDVIPFFMGKRLFEAANQPKSFYEIGKCHICGPQFYADSIAGKIKGMLMHRQE